MPSLLPLPSAFPSASSVNQQRGKKNHLGSRASFCACNANTISVPLCNHRPFFPSPGSNLYKTMNCLTESALSFVSKATVCPGKSHKGVLATANLSSHSWPYNIPPVLRFITLLESLTSTVQILKNRNSSAARSWETATFGRWLGQKHLHPGKSSPADSACQRLREQQCPNSQQSGTFLPKSGSLKRNSK